MFAKRVDTYVSSRVVECSETTSQKGLMCKCHDVASRMKSGVLRSCRQAAAAGIVASSASFYNDP